MRWRRFIPGALAARGETLWIADVSRPCLLEIQGGRFIQAHWWGSPETLGSSASRLHADESGVWVVAADRVVHCDLQGVIAEMLSEPVGVTALGHSTLAAALPHSWPTRSGPDRVRQLSAVGVVAEVEVPGDIHALVPTIDGFLAYVVDHGSTTTTALFDRSARLATIGAVGELTLGPALEPCPELHSTLVGGSHPAVLAWDGQRWPPRLTAVLTDLSPADGGLPFAPLETWSCAHSGASVVVWTHLPDGTGPAGWWPLPGPIETSTDHSYLLTALDLAVGSPVVTWVVPGYPVHGAWASPELFWVNLHWTEGGEPRRVVMSWDVSGSGAVAELDVAEIGGSDLALPIAPPSTEGDLAQQVEEQRRFFEEELRASRMFETLEVTTEGEWPEVHVVAQIRLPHLAELVGRMAWPLFDGEGQPVEWDWTDHVATDIDERAGGLGRIASGTPEGEPVWLRVPAGIEGLIPEL